MNIIFRERKWHERHEEECFIWVTVAELLGKLSPSIPTEIF
jgi:hypothetical protein